jgi:YYY domain-containing protein
MVGLGLLEPAFSQGQTSVYRVASPGRPTMLTSDIELAPPSAATPPPLLLDTAVNQLPAVDEYAWNSLVRDSSWASALLWLLGWYALAALGMPLAFAALGGWRDAGAGVAKLVGWLLLGYAVWLPTSLKLWSYDLRALLGGLLLVLALDALALWWVGRGLRAATQGEGAGQLTTIGHGLASMGRALRRRRRAVVQSELVFLAGFAALALVRALNPDLWHPTWGGEKPMEFGFLNAILRSPVMPPYDPFYSDGYINYYYYGLYLVSLPIKALGIAPAIGFNLGVATVFGLLLAAAFALAAEATRLARYGLVAAFLVGVAGNGAGVFAVGWSRGLTAISGALAGGLPGLGERLGDWYIGPSRVIPYTINEFPAFTFLFADLHPHMIALPIGVLAAALAYRVVAGGGGADDSLLARFAVSGRRGRSLPVIGLLALALGALAVTNSWDFPTYALLLGLASLGAAWRRGAQEHAGPAPLLRLVGAGLGAVGVALAGLALYAPFFDRYFAFVRGVGAVPLSGGTTVLDYLVAYGPALAVALPLAIGAAWRSLAPRRDPADDRPAWRQLLGLGPRWGIMAAAAVIALGAALLPGQALRLLLAGLLILVTPALLRRGPAPAAWYALALAWVAWAVSLGVELVYIRDHLDGGDWYRMNTVFKFGLQAWALLGLAAALGLPALLRGLRRFGGEVAQSVGLATLAVVAALAAVYPLAATPSRVANRFAVAGGPTLDGLAFMREASFPYDCSSFGGCLNGAASTTIDLSGDAEAIGWINREIVGTPILVQSNLWFYRAYGIRIAANTGLPTVISALHVNEQRDPALTGVRDRDVEAFYSTPSVEEALRFLGKYRVNYVYVGGVERAVYPVDGLDKFATMRGTYLDVVYDTPKVQIYQVTNVPGFYARPEPYNFGADEQPLTAPAEPAAGEPPADLADFEAAVQADPGNGPMAFGLADRYRSIGRLDDAARVLAPAAAANPGDVGLHHLWGDILNDAGRYDEAELAYLGAVQADPSANNYYKLGEALLRWGRVDKAEIALSQAAQADPALPEPHYQLGLLFKERGESARAAAELRAYLQLAPDGPFAAGAQELLASLDQS